jgi:hypothetical protein
VIAPANLFRNLAGVFRNCYFVGLTFSPRRCLV